MKNQNIEQSIFPVSIDPVIFSIIDDKLHVLLIKRQSETFDGMQALPGGLLHKTDTTIEEGLNRILNKKTGVEANYSEQLYTRTGHDPRGPTIAIAYMALVNAQQVTSNAKWVAVEKAQEMRLAFDHSEVIDKAVERLTNKVNYSTLPMHFLGDKFTLPKLQKVYEILLQEKLDKSTFRKKIEDTGVLVETGEMEREGAFRPSKLYSVSGFSNVYNFNKNILG